MRLTTKTIEKILGVSADDAAERLDELTPREVEVAGKFADGLDARQIADELAISPKTVDIHRGNFKTKLGVNSTVNLVRIVLLRRLVDAMTKVARRQARSN
jgi:two-component system, LuxR family, response regulator FixJ